MHVFQPMDIKNTDINPFTMIGTDFFAITVKSGDKINAMTAGWGGFGVMWGVNVAYLAVRDSRYTRELMDEADTFSMTFFNMKSKQNKMILKYLGGISGHDEDKIKNASLVINYVDDTPYIDEGSLVYICKKLSKTPISPDSFADPAIQKRWYKDGDYHNIYIAEITKMLAR